MIRLKASCSEYFRIIHRGVPSHVWWLFNGCNWLYHLGPIGFPVFSASPVTRAFPRLARVDDRIDAAFDVTWVYFACAAGISMKRVTNRWPMETYGYLCCCVQQRIASPSKWLSGAALCIVSLHMLHGCSDINDLLQDSSMNSLSVHSASLALTHTCAHLRHF